MNENDIRSRLILLFTALQYSSEKTAMLSVGERILINQERGHWFRQLSLLEQEPNAYFDDYEQTEKINRKVNTIKDLIHTTGWEPKEKND